MSVKLQLTLGKTLSNISVRALEIASKIGGAAAAKNPTAALTA